MHPPQKRHPLSAAAVAAALAVVEQQLAQPTRRPTEEDRKALKPIRDYFDAQGDKGVMGYSSLLTHVGSLPLDSPGMQPEIRAGIRDLLLPRLREMHHHQL